MATEATSGFQGILTLGTATECGSLGTERIIEKGTRVGGEFRVMAHKGACNRKDALDIPVKIPPLNRW